MKKRMKDLATMIEAAGLVIVQSCQENGRVTVVGMAPNGVTAKFSISSTSKTDLRGDMNESGRMKRFARANPAPEIAEPSTTQAPTKEPTEMLKHAPATAAPARAPKPRTPELTPAAFYRLCEWLKTLDLKTVPAFDALVMQASQWAGHPVEEATVRDAMGATETAEPARWALPKEPHLVVAHELVTFMRSLGTEPPASLVDMLNAAKAGT